MFWENLPTYRLIDTIQEKISMRRCGGEHQIESCEECQRLRKILPLKKFNQLFENERYTVEITEGHLCRMIVR